jgi:hypothetical protein
MVRWQARQAPRASASASAASPSGDSGSAGQQFSQAFYRTRLLTFAAMFVGYGAHITHGAGVALPHQPLQQ